MQGVKRNNYGGVEPRVAVLANVRRAPDSPMLARKVARLGSVYMPAYTAVRTTKV